MTKPTFPANFPAKASHAAANAGGYTSRQFGRFRGKEQRPPEAGGAIKNLGVLSGLIRWLSPLASRSASQSASRSASQLASRLLALCISGGAAAAKAEDAPIVQLDTTAGEIRIQLFPDKAPRTVENFLQLVEGSFYDGLIFHRVVANFVIQAGGYDAEMNYRKPPRTVVNESSNGLRNRRGTVAMARLADPDSADAQFFINVNNNTHLDAKPGQPGYTVFGGVVAGMNAVTAIELSDTEVRQGMAAVPATPIVIHRLARISPTND